MLLVFGSIFVLAAGVVAYFKARKIFPYLNEEILYEIKYNAIGTKAVFEDFLEAKRNKVVLPRKTGHVAIVTGGSRGIGLEVVKMLLQCDMEVIIACRSPAAGDKAIRLIRESGITEGEVKVYELDNSSLKSVRKFAEMIKKDYSKLHILINNAGIMFTPYAETEEGFEQQWGVNYLSHFLLTALLLPLLKEASSIEECARIVNVSSCAHYAGVINFDDINNNKKHFITSAAYGQSKVAQVMFTKSLYERIIRKRLCIMANTVHPGIVNTDLFNNTFLKKYAGWLMNLFFKTSKQGATSIVYAAVSNNLENVGGKYISNCKEKVASFYVEDIDLRHRLFELSLDQVGLKDFFEEL